MYPQKVISRKTFLSSFLLASWRPVTKMAGSGSASGSISQMHGSTHPDDPDPHQNVMDPEHWCADRNISDPGSAIIWLSGIQVQQQRHWLKLVDNLIPNFFKVILFCRYNKNVKNYIQQDRNAFSGSKFGSAQIRISLANRICTEVNAGFGSVLKFQADPKNWYRKKGNERVLGRVRTLKREDHRKENIQWRSFYAVKT